jgi:ribosome-binding protein aMBF1 (putative translation factor)
LKYFKQSLLSQDKHAIERLAGIQEELSKRNMKISHLAKAINLNHSVVYQWCTGTCYPTPENYNKLADFFGWPHFREGKHDGN